MRAPVSQRVFRPYVPGTPNAPITANASANVGVPSYEEISQRLRDVSRESTAISPTPYRTYSRENLAPPPPMDLNLAPRLSTPQQSIRLPVVHQNQMGNQMQQNQGQQGFGTSVAPNQMNTYTTYTPTSNGLVTTVETTTVQVEATPPPNDPLPMEEVDPSCCCPRDSDELHYSYSVLSDSLAGRMMRVLLLSVPISMGLIGYFFKDDCPHRSWIPFWLMVAGVIWIAHTLLYFLFQNNPGKNTCACRFIETICFYLAAIWFVLGSIWTYGGVHPNIFHRTDEPNTNSTTSHPMGPDYCHPAPFIFACSVIGLGYCVIAVIIFYVLYTFQYTYNLNPPVQNPKTPIVPSNQMYSRH